MLTGFTCPQRSMYILYTRTKYEACKIQGACIYTKYATYAVNTILRIVLASINVWFISYHMFGVIELYPTTAIVDGFDVKKTNPKMGPPHCQVAQWNRNNIRVPAIERGDVLMHLRRENGYVRTVTSMFRIRCTPPSLPEKRVPLFRGQF